MSLMIERVALAMAKSEGDLVMDHWRRRARAAIESMRPSRELIWHAVNNLRLTPNYIHGHDFTCDEALRIFNAVIDAALTEEP